MYINREGELMSSQGETDAESEPPITPPVENTHHTQYLKQYDITEKTSNQRNSNINQILSSFKKEKDQFN
jgi:hypothetical protein